MNAREIVTRVGLIVLLDATAPLLPNRSEGFDTCCSETGECPEGLTCTRDSSCGPQARGYCVLIDTIGR